MDLKSCEQLIRTASLKHSAQTLTSLGSASPWMMLRIEM